MQSKVERFALSPALRRTGLMAAMWLGSAWLTGLVCLTCLGASAASEPGEADHPGVLHTEGEPVRAPVFIKGADLSFLQEIENHGGVYKEDGSKKDLVEMLKDHGFNYARLRIWHAPREGYCGLDSTVLMAKRIKAEGMGLLLDFHYSDTWADPGKQYKPGAWEGLAFGALKDSVYEYTRFVIGRLKSQNALPDMVQLGNEITCGILWDDGRVCGGFDTPDQWSNLGGLLARGIDGVNAALDRGDSVSIMLHIDRAADTVGSIWFLDNLLAQGIDFDIIGLSFYPWWHGTLDEVHANLDTLASRYDKDILVAETAYPWTLDGHDGMHNIVGLPEQLHPGYPATVSGQRAFLSDLMETIADTHNCRGRGVFYWAPDYVPVSDMGSPWENLTLFDFDGNLLPSVGAFEADRECRH